MRKTAFCLLLLSCATAFVQAQPPNARDVTEFRIDPSYARTGAASLFFKEVKFIPLQTSEESYVGRVDKIEVHNGHFIIQDRESDALSIFKDDGSFVSQIRAIPGINKGRRRLELIYNFCIDHETGNIIVYSRYTPNKLYVFDLKGKYLNKIYYVPMKTSDFITLEGDRIATRPQRPHRYYTRDGKEYVPYEGHDPYSLFITLKDSTILKKLLPVDNQKAATEDESMGYYLNFNYSGRAGKAFYKRFFDYHFYEVSANGIDKEYSIIFPMHKSLPPNFLNDSVGVRHRYMSSPGLITALNDVFRAGDIFSFSWLALGGVLEARADILYNTKTGNSVYLGAVTPDSLTQFLPPFNFVDNLLACDGTRFYGALSSMIMHSAKDRIKNPSFNPVMTEYFKHSTSQSNPVIVQLLPREDL